MWVQNPVNNFFIAHLDSDGCWVVWRSFLYHELLPRLWRS